MQERALLFIPNKFQFSLNEFISKMKYISEYHIILQKLFSSINFTKSIIYNICIIFIIEIDTFILLYILYIYKKNKYNLL